VTAIRQDVQPGTTARLRVEVATSPAQLGRAGAFDLKEAFITVDGVPTDLELAAAPFTTPSMVERAYGDGVATASLTGPPVYVAGGGPGAENVYNLPVASSAGYAALQYTRGVGQPEGQGQVYKVVDVPDGTTVQVHAKDAGMDIVNGDSIETVVSNGEYAGFFDLPVDTYMNPGSTSAEVRVVVGLTTGGVDPAFDSADTLSWTFGLTLDVDRAYRAG
jgi:hypothetical protein